MRVFPSILASIVTGAVVMPLFIAGMEFLVSALHPGILLLAVQLFWGIIAFLVPVAFSTMDLKYVRQRQRDIGGDIFTVLASREDFSELYVPTSIRMGLLVVSLLVALTTLERLGVHI